MLVIFHFIFCVISLVFPDFLLFYFTFPACVELCYGIWRHERLQMQETWSKIETARWTPHMWMEIGSQSFIFGIDVYSIRNGSFKLESLSFHIQNIFNFSKSVTEKLVLGYSRGEEHLKEEILCFGSLVNHHFSWNIMSVLLVAVWQKPRDTVIFLAFPFLGCL